LPVSVEISGLLERRLRRLVDLGLYSSVSEAVRDAVRALFERLDLRALALELYTVREASLGYVVEFSGETFEGIIDYMLSRGVPPVIGALNPVDIGVLGGPVLLDPLTVHVIYKSYLADMALKLNDSGLKFYAPHVAAPQVQVLEAIRARRGLNSRFFIEYVEVNVGEEESYGRILVTPLERALVDYARSEGLTLLSDDVRVRSYALRYGVKTLSSLSIAETYITMFGKPPNIEDALMSLKAIPLIIPREVEERWLGITR
jgi:Arc/MetJ-type ribon-helix-helix transcriptional regulator